MLSRFTSGIRYDGSLSKYKLNKCCGASSGLNYCYQGGRNLGLQLLCAIVAHVVAPDPLSTPSARFFRIPST